jgi:hypothetical protein
LRRFEQKLQKNSLFSLLKKLSNAWKVLLGLNDVIILSGKVLRKASTPKDEKEKNDKKTDL